MRLRFIAVASLLLAPSLFAEDHLHIFVSDLGYASSKYYGDEWSGGVGIGLSHVWNPRWSIEGSIAMERRHTDVTRFGLGPITYRENLDSFPIDVGVYFRFPTDSRWTPYLTAGVRYVEAPSNAFKPLVFIPGVPVLVSPRDQASNRTSGEVGVGATFRITPKAGLQFDVKRLLRNDSTNFDPLTKGSVGINLSF